MPFLFCMHCTATPSNARVSVAGERSLAIAYFPLSSPFAGRNSSTNRLRLNPCQNKRRRMR
jgi:hypothetical protein